MSLDATPQQPLTADRVLAFAHDVVEKARSDGSKVIVVYYVGHGGTTADGGDIVLFQGSEPPLRLDVLDDALDLEGVPHALLADQCMENHDIEELARDQGFILNRRTGDLDYVGPNEIVTDELGPIAAALRNYPEQHPFLQTSNPVVLAAKPGTAALARPNPQWQLGSQVGPLAARLHYLEQRAPELALEDLGQHIKLLPQSGRLGEIGFTGSVSWSDFGAFERAAHAARRDGRRLQSTSTLRLLWKPSAELEVLKRFVPLDGGWIGSVRWDVLRRKGDKQTVLMSDVSVGAMSGDEQCVWFTANSSELFAVTTKGKPQLVRGDLFVDALGPSFEPGSALAIVQSDSNSLRRVLRLTVDAGTLLGTVEAPGFGCGIAEWPPGAVHFSLPERGEVHRVADGGSVLVRSGLKKPGAIASATDALYILSTDARALYRYSSSGAWAVSDLMSADREGLLQNPTDGFAAVDDSHFLVSSLAGLVEVRVPKDGWTSLEDGQ